MIKIGEVEKQRLYGGVVKTGVGDSSNFFAEYELEAAGAVPSTEQRGAYELQGRVFVSRGDDLYVRIK